LIKLRRKETKIKKWYITLVATNRRLKEDYGHLKKMKNSSNTLKLMDMVVGAQFQNLLVLKQTLYIYNLLFH
jgi:hypothetical protein